MKVGILTQPLRTNYGGILQNYALQQALKSLNHKPVTLDYNTRYSPANWILGEIKSLIKHSPHNVEFPRYFRSGQGNLNRFVHNEINMTKSYKGLPLRDFAMTIDAIIVGSDQVWRPKCNVPVEWMYEMYLESIQDINIPKIAYAASFGSEEWEYNKEQENRCANLIKKFKSVSVREESGIVLCDKYLNTKAIQVLDPTMLLEAKDYLPFINKESIYNKPTLFAYLLDTSQEKIDLIKQIACKKNLSVFIKGANDDISRIDSIEKWLQWIHDANYIITDSFHGAVFSILFHRPFNIFMDSWRGSARFKSLLKMIECLNRGIYPDREIISTEDIDWIAVSSKIAKMRTESLMFLKKSLL